MRYYAEYDAKGKLFAIGMGALNGVEITREEYEALCAQISGAAQEEAQAAAYGEAQAAL